MTRAQRRSLRLRSLWRSVHAFPANVLTLGVLVTLAVLMLEGWNASHLYHSLKEFSAETLRNQRLIGRIVHLDEVLTMSARMAAVTGDPTWESRYRHFEPQLNAAIEEAVRHAPDDVLAAVQATDDANQALVALENRAFALVRQGQRAEAAELLSGDVYAENKRIYSDGMQLLTASLDQHIQEKSDGSARQLIGFAALAGLGAAMLLMAWGGLVAFIGRQLADREREQQQRWALEAQIQHAQKLESLGVLAGGIAHDFNNLLLPILGHADLALTDVSPESAAAARLGRIRDAGRRLSQLSNQLLAYSGKGAFSLRSLDLSKLVADMKDLLELSVSKRARLRFELAPELPAIAGDEAQLGQVVMNFVTNASEALGDESGTITVRTAPRELDAADVSAAYVGEDCAPGSYVALEVEDSGAGMDAATQSRIFDPFFTTKFTGRGLGLAVVVGIVRGHHGVLRVRSEPGRGTLVRAWFPLAGSDTSHASGPAQAPTAVRGAGTVLVVDDEPDVRELTEDMLRSLGYTVHTAEDGGGALAKLRERRAEISLVLLDMTMPGLGVRDTLRGIRELCPELPVVLMSGYSADHLAASVGETGLAFLKKPFMRDELARVLRTDA